MTDVFIRVFSCSELRLGFAIATVARWKMQKDCRVHILYWTDGIPHDWWAGHKEGEWIGHSVNTTEFPFATFSLEQAEKVSISDPYIICNDDNLPYGHDFVSKGLRLMEENPEFGCVSGMVVNGDPYPKEWPDVQEIHAVGGLVFLRKGLVTEFKALEDCFWDGYRHAQVVAKGFKSGTSKKLPYLHMGAHFSVANPAFFVGA